MAREAIRRTHWLPRDFRAVSHSVATPTLCWEARRCREGFCTSFQDVELVEEAGGAPVEEDGRAAAVPVAAPQTGLPGAVLLGVQLSVVGGVPAWGGGGRVGVRVRVGVGVRVGVTPGPGVEVAVRVSLRGVVGVRVCVDFLCAVGGAGVGQGHFGEQPPSSLRPPAVLLTVVLSEAVVLGAFLALVVGSRAGEGGQVTVLGPDPRGHGVEGVFGVPGFAALLQEFIDGEGGVLGSHQPALVLGGFRNATLALLRRSSDQAKQLWVTENRNNLVTLSSVCLGNTLRLLSIYSHGKSYFR